MLWQQLAANKNFVTKSFLIVNVLKSIEMKKNPESLAAMQVTAKNLLKFMNLNIFGARPPSGKLNAQNE